MTARCAVVVIAAMAAACRGLVAGEVVAEPGGYRMENYRAPVPESLTGGRRLSTAEAEALWREKTSAFIDVLPRPPRPKGLPEKTVWRDTPRRDIPRSIWLPDTGYGRLSPAMEDYFRRGLDHASHGDKSASLVFYCQAECWMSWNAAKRALTYGYLHVAWYPDGTDGWQKAGLATEEVEPQPRPDE